jgi:adenylate cyclase
VPEIRRGAAGVAPVNLITDPDGVVRRAPLRIRLGTEWFDAFDVKIYQVLAAAGARVARLPNERDILINYRGGPGTFAWVPFYHVYRGEIAPEAFRDKIVLIGTTSEVLHDRFKTPFASNGSMPGVEIHANVLETYISGNWIREVPPWLCVVLAIASALFGAAVVVRLHPLRGFLTALFAWLVLAGATLAMFAFADVWVRAMGATLGLVLGYGATTVERYVREQREKRRLSQFFSPGVLQHVVRQKQSLGSNRRLVTVLFSDLRGFTPMSEKLEPEQVAEILQEYLTEMTEIVFRHGGTVDKYIGDCVMALYNAPLEDAQHAAHAVRSALEFQERTLAVSKKWEAKLGVRLQSGVGINTGDAVVGTMGSLRRLEYTAIGDTINLGARLESITKEYDASIIISESTFALVAGQFVTRELGAVTVRGKTQPVKIYAVLADRGVDGACGKIAP